MLPFLLPQDEPKDAVGHLLPDYDWPFDHRGGPGIVQWVAKRLQEHWNEMNWTSPRAQFPRSEDQPGLPVGSGGLSIKATGFDQRVCKGSKDPHRDIKPWIKLICYSPPKGNPPSNLKTKWLPYLYRGPVPDDCIVRFPPLSCALMTMMSEPEWSQAATLQLFGTFTDCEVEVLAPRYGGQALRLNGLNGVTVLFLSLVESGPAATLIELQNTGEMILSDIVRHPGTPMLPEERDAQRSAWDSAFVKAIDRLCEEAFYAKFVNSPALRRIKLLVRVWLLRQHRTERFSRSSTPERDALHELTSLLGPATRFIGQGNSSISREARSQATKRHFLKSLGMLGVIYGCAISELATSALDHRPHAPQRSQPRALPLHCDGADQQGSSERHCDLTWVSTSSTSTSQTLVVSRPQAKAHSNEGGRCRFLLQLMSEQLVHIGERDSICFYGHLTRTILFFLNHDSVRAELREWLKYTEHRACFTPFAPPRRPFGPWPPRPPRR